MNVFSHDLQKTSRWLLSLPLWSFKSNYSRLNVNVPYAFSSGTYTTVEPEELRCLSIPQRPVVISVGARATTGGCCCCSLSCSWGGAPAFSCDAGDGSQLWFWNGAAPFSGHSSLLELGKHPRSLFPFSYHLLFHRQLGYVFLMLFIFVYIKNCL